MAASVIIVSSNSFDESVGSPPSRVILFGDIPTVIPSTLVIAPETSTIAPTTIQDPYDIIVARWRSRVTTRRPYCTRPNGPRRVMTARKRVGRLPAHRLAWRRVSPRYSDHRPSSSGSPMDSSPVHSLCLDAPDQAYSRSSNRVVSPRLGYPPSHHQEIHQRDHCIHLHNLLDHLARDVGPPTDSVPSFTPITGSLAPTRADLLPPHKRELDIINRDDARDRVEIDNRDARDNTEEYEADTSAGDTVEVGIDPMSAPVADEESEEPAREDSSDFSGTRDGIVRSFEDMPIDLDDVVRDFYHYMSEVHIDRIVGIEIVQRRLEAARVPDARGKTYVLGGGDANPDSNTIMGTFLLNDHHAYMLFDSGANRSFVSNTFSTLLEITPSALDVSYTVELADERTSETQTMLRGCTLGLLGHPFNIDMMPINLGSFDVIISMDWLAKNHAVIVCDEKIVRIPYGNKILIVQGDIRDKGKKSTLSIISCLKTQKYMEKGCQVFLTQVTKKEIEDKSKEKRLNDVPTVQDFLGVFPEDLPGLPSI
uniref:Putative reverse transcriptase domain-containing protein n=1 Tax=Tanacetum cinerariifolium TaxID=118510 RepID=A0A699HVS6_TANCI|nr:putative reverse transcriptase domain-containing protein [Tanacetum cinerariifolium]